MATLFGSFNQLITSEFHLNIRQIVKEFDEAIYIPPSQVDISLEDLVKGEGFVAELIVSAFQNKKKFFQVGKEECLYKMNN